MDGYILIDTEIGKARTVAEQALQIEGVHFAEIVSGPYDVVVRVLHACDGDSIRCVQEQFQAIPGVTRAVVCPVAIHRVLAHV